MSGRPVRRGGTKLRRAAEARLAELSSRPSPLPGSPAELLQELRVHQVELEMQNEELRRAQGALEEARDRYVELYDFAPVGYLTLDAGGRIAGINLTGASLLGVDRAELSARPFDRFVAPQDHLRWVSHLERVRASETPQGCELLLRPARRDPFPVQLTSVRMPSTGDAPVGIRCTLVDVTDRRRAEEERERRMVELVGLNQQLERAHLQLLQADKLAAIGQLAAGVAHEINNPLSYVMSNLFLVEEYLKEILDAPPAGAEGAGLAQVRRDPAKPDLATVRRDLVQCLAESREGMERVSRVVKDLKAFAHPDSGRWQVADLHEIVEGVLRIVAASLVESARLVRDYGEESLRIRCRPMQLGQVFMNLLVNASQAMGTNGTITVRTGRAGAEAWVEIEDNGAGIPSGDLNRLFEPFFTTRAIGVGSGLGLSIAHGIVRGHGGRIEVRSSLGAGSTFRIVLPIGGAESAPMPQGKAPAR
ncbi:MAG: ATP-binding protein [Anaeromyxobacteraceae bacterium]